MEREAAVKAGRVRAKREAHPWTRLAGWTRGGILRELSPAAGNILVTLAMHGSPNNLCFPAISTMARLTPHTLTTISGALAELEAGGLISDQGRIRRKGKPGPGPTMWAIAEPPATPEAWQGVIRKVRSHREEARARRHPVTLLTGRKDRRPRNERGQFAKGGISPPREESTLSPPREETDLYDVAATAARATRRRPRSATGPAPSRRTACKGRRGERRLQNAAAVAELTRLVRSAPLAQRGELVRDLARQGHPARHIEAAIEQVAALDQAPLGREDRASDQPRVPSEGSGSRAGAEGEEVAGAPDPLRSMRLVDQLTPDGMMKLVYRVLSTDHRILVFKGSIEEWTRWTPPECLRDESQRSSWPTVEG